MKFNSNEALKIYNKPKVFKANFSKNTFSEIFENVHHEIRFEQCKKSNSLSTTKNRSIYSKVFREKGVLKI